MDELNAGYEQVMIEQQLEEIDADYIIEEINNQIDNVFEDTVKKNFLKDFDKNIENNDIEEELANNYRDMVYSNIIKKISSKYQFSVDDGSTSLKKLAKTLYKFFILEYIDNVILFFENYIIENQDDIYYKLQHGENINTKSVDECPEKIALIIRNISNVIKIISTEQYTIEDFINTLQRSDNCTSATDKMQDYLDEVLYDMDEAYNIMMKPIFNEEYGFSEVYSTLQLNLYNRFN